MKNNELRNLTDAELLKKIDECMDLFNQRKQLYEDSLSGRVVKDIK